jgi:hypothetical protein
MILFWEEHVTNRGLRKRLLFSAIAVAIILAISLTEYIFRYPTSSTTFIGSNATLFALLVASYLAYAFQQRGKFIDEIRNWWGEIVAARSAFFSYCDREEATEDEYLSSFYKLSTAMDTLRLIYCNVSRDGQNPKGYYPFEQVRDIIDIARSLHPSGAPTLADRQRGKQGITLVFQSLRHAIQSEATATTPDNPTLFESQHRARYLEEIKEKLGLDILEVRRANKSADYVSSRERF